VLAFVCEQSQVSSLQEQLGGAQEQLGAAKRQLEAQVRRERGSQLLPFAACFQ